MNSQIITDLYFASQKGRFFGLIKKIIFRIALVIVSFMLIAIESKCDVRVRPSAIYLNDSVLTGMVTVTNDSDNPTDVAVTLRYGYPTSDSFGNPSLNISDVPNGSQSLYISWIQIYPQKFVIKPHDRQIIRMKINPPSVLKEGEYWIRPVLDVQSFSQNGSVNVRPSNHSQQFVLLANYRHGEAFTGLAIERIMPILRPDGKITLKLDLERKGNAAYRGSITCKIKDQNQKTISTIKRNIAVYERLTQNLTVEELNFQDGFYTVDIVAKTNRDETDNSTLINAPDVYKQASFLISDNHFSTPGVAYSTNLQPTISDSPAAISGSITSTSSAKPSNQSAQPESNNSKVKLLEQRLKQLNADLEIVMKELQAMK
jgi:hypothetical protein